MTREPEPSRQHPPDLYRRLIEEVHDYAIFLTDLAGRVVSWNGGAERLLGWRPRRGRSLPTIPRAPGCRR